VSLVVSDAGLLRYLVLCDAIEVVQKLYGQLLIPPGGEVILAPPQMAGVNSLSPQAA
jgi:hypothetical protein